MPFRLLAFDYDGTAAVDGALPSPRVVAAIEAALSAGIHLVLATGRSYPSASRYAAALGLRDPVICMQGAMVKELADGRRTLLCEPLPCEPLRDLLARAEELDLDLTIYGEDHFYYVDMRHPQAFYDRWFGLPMYRVGSFGEACDRLAARGQQPLKALIIGEPEQNDRVIGELRAVCAGRLAVVRSHALFVEVMSPRASKGQALAFLAQRFGIAREETLAVGDSDNDISMIRWAGMGVAMGNATDDVKAVADWIAPSVAEDGLAAVIERLALGRNDHADRD
ncbi:MAG: Cof-type HAD-IIB family hydrolase [Anaerolineae bacterium]|nr:Cof-type HAD-IIB family hydrolase [Anaerolineae bacterium]